MKRLAECAGRELLWAQRSHFSVESQLHDGEEVCARLEWHWGFNPTAEGETEEGRWRFRRRGFFSGVHEIFTAGEDQPLATCRFRWWTGTLRFRDGREWSWRRESFWGGRWRFETGSGAPLLHMRRRFAFPGTRAVFRLEPELAASSEASMLTLFGWYLILRLRRRAHAY